MSRSIDFLAVVGDLNTLEEDPTRSRRYDNLDDDERQVRVTMGQDVQNWIQSLFEYYRHWWSSASAKSNEHYVIGNLSTQPCSLLITPGHATDSSAGNQDIREL